MSNMNKHYLVQATIWGRVHYCTIIHTLVLEMQSLIENRLYHFTTSSTKSTKEIHGNYEIFKYSTSAAVFDMFFNT